MDDTLISSASTWKNAEIKLFKHLGKDYSPEIAEHYKGMNAMDVGRSIYRYTDPEIEISADECGSLMRKWLINEFDSPLYPMPGADILLKNLYNRVDMAVASGSPREGILKVINRLGWSKYFKLIISSEEVENGKPSPDVFLEAAKRMDCAANDAIVIEDSLHGVRAAKSAGMCCFAVPSSNDARIIKEADRVFDRLDLIPIELIVG